MSNRDIKAAFDVSKSVFLGEITQTTGARKLESDQGFNINSARDFIMVFKHLMRGESFKRGLSAPDMDAYLTFILADYGPDTLRTAVQSLWLHLRYYEGIRKVTMHKLRAVAAKHQVNASTLESLEEEQYNFEKAVRQSLNDSAIKRQERLKKAPKEPAKTPVTLFAFRRNPDVVAEVLVRANGVCERCNKEAPFIRRKDNSPYLEVHHLKHLANGGLDTVENAVALCPNCHRELHFGSISFS